MLAARSSTPHRAPAQLPLPRLGQQPAARPLRVMLYGVEGVGKSTFGSHAPSPVFLGPDAGTSHLDVARFATPRTWSDALDALRVLTYEEHAFETLVIDTLDWLEPLCWQHVCMVAGVAHIDEVPYGKGYTNAVEQWRLFVARLELLITTRRMNVVLLGHCTVKHAEGPQGQFDRFQLALHERSAEVLHAWADAVLFARHEEVRIERPGPPRRSPSARVVHTTEAPGWDAKNGFNLPPAMPLSWEELTDHVDAFRPADADALRAQLAEWIPRIHEAARAEQVMRDWAKDDPSRLFQLLQRVKSKFALEAAGGEG